TVQVLGGSRASLAVRHPLLRLLLRFSPKSLRHKADRIFKPRFSMARSYIAGQGEVSNFFWWMKNPLLYRSARTKANGTRAKGCVIVPLGPSESERYRRLRWQAVFGSQIVWNKSTGRAGERGGAWVGRPR